MIKRFLSFLLVLTMVATMLPAAITAESADVTASPRAGTHSAAHKCDSCDATNWTPWPTDGTIPTSGHYYLTNNVQLSGVIGLSNKKLHICLNGFVMTAKPGNRLSWTYGTSELVITDCTAYEENGVYYAGSMTGGKNPDANGGGAFYLYAGSTVEIYDGKITNCTSTKGGGIYADGRMGLENVTVTGNVSGGAGYAVYLAPTEFDGHSNQTGHKFMGGNMIIKDNENGDMYLGEGTALAVTGERLGEKSHVNITLHSGVLSQWVLGVYDYEGGDRVYTLTAGDRSITDPEPIPAADTAAEETEMAPGSDIWLYVGIGVFVIAIAAVIVLLLKKKKKPAAVEEN